MKHQLFVAIVAVGTIVTLSIPVTAGAVHSDTLKNTDPGAAKTTAKAVGGIIPAVTTKSTGFGYEDKVYSSVDKGGASAKKQVTNGGEAPTMAANTEGKQGKESDTTAVKLTSADYINPGLPTRFIVNSKEVDPATIPSGTPVIMIPPSGIAVAGTFTDDGPTVARKANMLSNEAVSFLAARGGEAGIARIRSFEPTEYTSFRELGGTPQKLPYYGGTQLFNQIAKGGAGVDTAALAYLIDIRGPRTSSIVGGGGGGPGANKKADAADLSKKGQQ